jgi:hypothetical protein
LLPTKVPQQVRAREKSDSDAKITCYTLGPKPLAPEGKPENTAGTQVRQSLRPGLVFGLKDVLWFATGVLGEVIDMESRG